MTGLPTKGVEAHGSRLFFADRVFKASGCGVRSPLQRLPSAWHAPHGRDGPLGSHPGDCRPRRSTPMLAVGHHRRFPRESEAALESALAAPGQR